MKEPKIAQKSPYIINETIGEKYWCACGESKNQPYCDGSHHGSEFSPIKVDLEKARKVAYCGCKHSANGAFCDGAHTKL